MSIDKDVIKFLQSVISDALIGTGKSIKEMAELTGLSCQEIRSYVEKTRMPNLSKFLQIANALDIDAKKVLDIRTYFN